MRLVCGRDGFSGLEGPKSRRDGSGESSHDGCDDVSLFHGDRAQRGNEAGTAEGRRMHECRLHGQARAARHRAEFARSPVKLSIRTNIKKYV